MDSTEEAAQGMEKESAYHRQEERGQRARGTIESEVISLQRERDELKAMLYKCKQQLAETHANVQLLIAESDNLKRHYFQAQEKITDLRLELLQSKASQLPKFSGLSVDIMKRTAAERDEAWTNLHYITTERDNLQEMLKFTKEKAKDEKVYLEQRTEDLKNTLLTTQEEIVDLRLELLKASELPKSSGMTIEALKRTAAERDKAWSSLNYVTTERDNLQEMLKLTQEKAKDEMAYLEQKIENLRNSLLTLQQERLEHNKAKSQMTDTMATLKKEVNLLCTKLEASQQEFSRLKTEYSVLSLKYTQLESELNSTQRQLTNKFRELFDAQEKNKQLNKINDSLEKVVNAQNDELRQVHRNVSKLETDNQGLQKQLNMKSDLLTSSKKQLREKENTMDLQNKDYERTIKALRETVIRREDEINGMRKRLSESQSELWSTIKDKDASLEKNVQLKEELGQARIEQQVLQRKLDKENQEIVDLNKTLKNCVSDISYKENLLNSKKLECKELQELCKQALVQTEMWEKQAKQTEAEFIKLHLELNTSKTEKSELEEKLANMDSSLGKVLSAQVKCNTDLVQLNRTLQQRDSEFHELQDEHSVTKCNLEKTRELCVKLDAEKEAAQQELKKCLSEVEMLRKQLANSERTWETSWASSR